MISRLRLALPAALGVLLAACAGALPAAPAPAPAEPSQPAVPRAPPRDVATAAAIERALDGAHRSARSRARDADRHPVDTLLFFGIRPGMTVAEAWPGSDGWYTEILAPLLAESGKLYAAQMPPLAGNEFVAGVRRDFSAKLAALPEIYGKVSVTTLDADGAEIAPASSCDLVISVGSLHDWMNRGFVPQAFAAMHRALKPGGTLGIVDYRADPARPPDPRATNGYVNEQLAIQSIEAAGFELLERSEINGNPRDTRDYEQGVWTLPPYLRQGSRDLERFQAIGEADRFTLRFRKR
jgi:predicted methyltransferase